MKTRILSGLIMLPFLFILYFGKNVLSIACLIITLCAVYEFFNAFKKIEVRGSLPVVATSTTILYVGLILLNNWIGDNPMNLFLIATLTIFWLFISIIMSLLYLFKINDRKLEDAMVTITALVYIVFFIFHFALTDSLAVIINIPIVWLIVIASFATDIFAYFVGMTLGKHRLCPNISPKKSIEGSIGGIVGSVVCCGLFGIFFMKTMLIHCLVIGILGGVVSQLGDLTASIFKRKIGIKDYGNLIPGHGGILDRFDSVIFVSPVVFYYMFIITMF
ncbi:MAG: phosphatidate cytidylyltransferase [Eubacteriales bacterium]|nr:phosphatidate cytidylyltransferase [Eubacteriales bacterium]MDY3332991.1 phosphatidate cytidylyltransferase [Gallibacter sp.]